jgi:alanine-synthesizing transaminase
MNALVESISDHTSQKLITVSSPLDDPRQARLHDALDDLRSIQHRRVLDGQQVWDLSMVNPDLAPPRIVLDRLLESVTKPTNHRYAVSRGVRRLREAFAVKYSTRFGVSLNPETQVCVCLGSKDATFHALRVLIKAGDSVVVAAPSYPAHPSAVALAGAKPIPWHVSADPNEAAKTLSSLLVASAAKVVLLNFPSNPAGAVVDSEWWREIGRVCAAHQATIINDFVYGEMTFSDAPAISALHSEQSGARCVEVYSLSKAYSVPGWRVGALVGNAEVVNAVSRIKSYADYGLFLPLQYAAAVALTTSDDIVRPTTQIYERRLRVLAAGLQGIGWKPRIPRAGACVWVEYPRTLVEDVEVGQSRSLSVANRLLRACGVVVTPGIVFGEDYDAFVRFAAVTTEERLRDVVTIMGAER